MVGHRLGSGSCCADHFRACTDGCLCEKNKKQERKFKRPALVRYFSEIFKSKLTLLLLVEFHFQGCIPSLYSLSRYIDDKNVAISNVYERPPDSSVISMQDIQPTFACENHIYDNWPAVLSDD